VVAYEKVSQTAHRLEPFPRRVLYRKGTGADDSEPGVKYHGKSSTHALLPEEEQSGQAPQTAKKESTWRKIIIPLNLSDGRKTRSAKILLKPLWLRYASARKSRIQRRSNAR
jgi:hypothetical protein